ncbi:hypothetical protein LJC63_10875, partial [Ruminococcaceae bacterium OttesenSCG-928-L11]|nr:hypothetical protein [Ruminococcaceae bacterium OttesenSCG-928-L11]
YRAGQDHVGEVVDVIGGCRLFRRYFFCSDDMVSAPIFWMYMFGVVKAAPHFPHGIVTRLLF